MFTKNVQNAEFFDNLYNCIDKIVIKGYTFYRGKIVVKGNGHIS